MRLLLIGLGGFAGSVLRYVLAGLVQTGAGRTAFPIGTLVVNVLGCFAFGVLAELAEARGFLGPDARAFLLIGLLGGFTTYSAFAHETMGAARDGAVAVAAGNVIASVVLGLAALWAGRAAAHALWR